MKTSLLISFFSLVVVSTASAQLKKFEAGVLVPLSGPIAEYGVAIKNGVEIAIDENPSRFKNCNFTFEDTEYKSPTTISAFNKLTEVNRISLAYAFGGPMGEVLAPIAQMKSVPFITDSIDPKVSTNRKFVSRYVNSNFEYGDELAKYLLANGVRKISIFKTDNQYLDALVNGIKEAAKGKLEMEELANISPSDIDLKFLLPKVKKVKSGAFGLFLLPGQLSTFGKTFASDLKNQMIFGGDFIDSEAEVIASGGALEGTIFANNIVEKKFIEKYYTKHKNKAQLKFAAEGYDVANLIADKLCTESELLSGVQILEKLYNKSEARVGALGNTKFIQTETDDKYWTAPIGIFKASKNGSVLIQE